VPLALGQVLYESGEIMSHAYFPIDCVVSILYVMENGESAEIAIVGNEGMVGIALYMGGESTMSRAIVQNAGFAYRLDAKILKDEFAIRGAFSRILLMFASALMTQMVQTAACNRHHPVNQQLCRCMLQSPHRLPTNRISITHKPNRHPPGNPRSSPGAGQNGSSACMWPGPSATPSPRSTSNEASGSARGKKTTHFERARDTATFRRLRL